MPEVVDRQLALMGDLARELTKLQELPEWDALRQRMDEIRKLMERAMLSKLLIGNETVDPIDQRAVDYRRGYLKGTEDFLLYPERLVAQFEKVMERTQDSG
jgi:hypothetical protein